MFSSVRLFFRARFQSWLARRMPPSKTAELNVHNLFILPSLAGLYFLLASVLIWLLGTNYQNNLALSCSYLMWAIFVVAIFHTFSNLSGIKLKAHSPKPVFAGSDALCEIELSRRGEGSCENIILRWPDSRPQCIDLFPASNTSIQLPFKTTRRGIGRPGRLLIESYFPLGLLRCWTMLDLDVQVLVYPAPIAAGPLPEDSVSITEGDQVVEGGDDFIGLKRYQSGDSLKHVAWKHYARGRGLQVKDYCDYRSHLLWLDWACFPGLDRETRLGRLCDWVVRASKSDEGYGLRLPNQELLPQSGQVHREAVLKALALFELEDETRAN